MKKILLVLLVGVTFASFGQSEHSNYELEGNKLYWRKVFPQTGFGSDSLQKLVKKQILIRGIKIVNEEPGIIQAVFDKYIIGKQNTMSTMMAGLMEFDATITIEFKDEKYRVELSDMSKIMSYNSGFQNKRVLMPEKDELIRQDGTFRTGSAAIKYATERNKEFIGIFKLKTTEKKDW